MGTTGRAKLSLGLLLLALWGCSQHTVRTGAAADASYQNAVSTALGVQLDEDPEAAFGTLSRLARDPRRAQLEAMQSHALLSAAGLAAAEAGDRAAARAFYRSAIAQDPDHPDDWYRLAWTETLLKEHDEAARRLTHLARTWPELLVNLDQGLVFQLAAPWRTSVAPRVEVLQALADGGWQLASLGDSSVWLQLARDHLAQGNPDAARQALERVERADEWVAIQSERVFDGIAGPGDPAMVRRIAESNVDALIEAMSQTDVSPYVAIGLGSALLSLGQNEVVVLLADGLVTELSQAPADVAAEFADAVPWLLNYKAVALRREGLHDAAVATMIESLSAEEHGGPNVSQVLNLGSYLVALGRPAEALQQIHVVGQVSDYGRMVQALIELRAARMLDDRRMATAALAHLSKHRRQGATVYLDALLYADRGEEAAAYFIDLLASQEHRADALLFAQEFQRPEPLQGDVAYMARREALLDDASVREAITSVGRVLSFDLYDGADWK